MRTSPLIVPPPGKEIPDLSALPPATAAPGATLATLAPPPPAAPAPGAAPAATVTTMPGVPTPPPSMPMDRDFIIRNQIAERYLAGRLPLRGAQDFERYCREHPELIDELGLPERVHAGLRLLEAGGISPPWEEKPKAWWQKTPTIAGLGVLALAASVWALSVGGGIATRDQQIRQLKEHIAQQPIDPATSTRNVRLIPGRSAPSRRPALVLGGGPAQIADLRIDMSWSKFTAFRVTIDRQDQGRVAVVNYMLRDSNGDLRLALNDSLLGPGNYEFAIEGIGLHGDTVAQAWITIGVTH